MADINTIKNKKGFICDMDGVIYHGTELIPEAKNFLNWLNKNNKEFLFLTNSSERSPKELSMKLARMGLNVSEEHFYTSALATADFLSTQKPGCTAYCIGEPGLLNALYDAGVYMNEVNPDYVVIGETKNYNYQSICKATELVNNGARLIGTNPDMTGPAEGNVMIPACKALVAPVEMATGKNAYFLGKPNPLMVRTGIKRIGLTHYDIALVGDRMDTDIISGIESGTDTVLVLTGVTPDIATVKQFPYRPSVIIKNLDELCN